MRVALDAAYGRNPETYPLLVRLLAMVEGGKVKAVIVAKLDRLTRSVKDLCELLERFERRGVAPPRAFQSVGLTPE